MHRALSWWAEDFRNRAQHEDYVKHQVTGPHEKIGRQRREEVTQLASSLGLPPLTRPAANSLIAEAAASAGLDPVRVRASWRVASGFAHGRLWPDLRASEPRSVAPATTGYLVKFVVDDDKLAEMATACTWLLTHIPPRYQARCHAL